MKLKFLLGLLILATAVSVILVVNRDHEVKQKQNQIQSTTSKLLELQGDYEKLDQKQKEVEKQHNASQKEVKKLKLEKSKLLERQKALEAQIVAKRAKSQVAAQTLNTTAQNVSQIGKPDNFYKDFIYQHESGNRTTATNPNGCYGLGQDCNGIVLNKCGANYACQDSYFESYAKSRYGSWASAYATWLAQGWW